MEPYPRRPRPAEHRNAYRALMLALRALFTDPLAARRAIRTALDGGGLKYVQLALRTEPGTFGTPRPAGSIREVREVAADAVAAFARSREACTRPLMRDAADLLRPGIVEQAAERERRAVSKAAWEASEAVRHAENHRKDLDFCCQRWESEAWTLYFDDKAAATAAFRFVRAHGAAAFVIVFQKRPTRFGWMRLGPFVAHWRKRLFGSGNPYYVRALGDFRRRGERLAALLVDYPTRDRLTQLQEVAKATAAAKAALGPAPDLDLWKAPRRASVPVLDAMRLLSPRFPEDAAPEVRRQLVAMLVVLPSDASEPPDGSEPPPPEEINPVEMLIDRAIQLAQQHHHEEQKRGFHPHFTPGR